ncbi:MAG: polysaccharide biosynthesis C-terminal domain-containing protein, partial [Acidobacteria bacterium]|nr:polysaccharide biosynthesis C-terminal domain-containing protein [Acidobacteriota bacterium]
KVTTYGIAILVLLVAGLTAITPDLVRAITFGAPWSPEAYRTAAAVVPLVALGIAFQGVYLLTSIGLNLTNQTQYYPVSTFAAAGVGLGSGLLLMPRYGALGAAIAFLLSYVTLAATAAAFAGRHYPMRYETGRITRLLVAGTLASLAGIWLPAMHPLAGLLTRGLVVVAVFVGLLGVSGFLRQTELAVLRQQTARLFGRRSRRSGAD